MAKIWQSDLIKKYRPQHKAGEVRGSLYRLIMQDILANQLGNLQRTIARAENEHWKKQSANIKRARTKKQQFRLPNISDIVPKRSIHLRKTADTGKLITDTIKDRLTKTLRTTLNEAMLKGVDSKVITLKGRKVKVINPDLVNVFQKRITKDFIHYTRKDKTIGVPKNIRAIAITETKGAINNIKAEYMKQLQGENPELKINKTWVHNKRLSDTPRKGHREMHGKTLPMDENFIVPLYKMKQGKWQYVGETSMKAPHDENAPPEQVINCQCDIIYRAK